MRQFLLLYQLFNGETGTKSLNNFSEATQMKDGRAGIQNRAV